MNNIPENWNVYKVSECLEKVVNSVSPEPDKLYREIGIRSHAKGIFHKPLVTGKSIGNKRVFNVYPNCFVVNIVFAWEQAIAQTSEAEIGMIASHRFPMFKPKENRCDIDYITYFFKTLRGKYLLGLASPGGAGRNKTLGKGEFSKLELSLPPVLEQKKIAKILSAWDRAIEVTEKLLNNRKKQKKSFMQQLLTSKKRLPGFSGEWQSTPVKKMGKIVSGGTPDTKVGEYWEGDVLWMTPTDVTALKNRFINNTKRKITQSGVKNSSATLMPKGSLLVCTRATIGLMSISTTDITTNQGFKNIIPDEIHDVSFLYYLFNFFKNKLIAYACGSTFLELSKKDFERLSFVCPNMEEQKAISSVLSTSDKEIETLQQKLNHLKKEKKVLMQQLLTGKRRVTIDDEEEVAHA